MRLYLFRLWDFTKGEYTNDYADGYTFEYIMAINKAYLEMFNRIYVICE